jgi:hypothetical protein
LGGPIAGTQATGSVTFYVVDSQFRRVRNARRANGTIVQDSIVDLAAGAYSVTLDAQTAIVYPEGSRTARQYRDRVEYLVVPDSGTHAEDDIAVPDPQVAPPPVELTSLLDRATVTGGTSALTVQFTSLTLIPNTVVTVPNIAQSVLVKGHGPMKASATGGCAMAITPAGVTTLGSQKDTFWVYQAAAGADLTANPEALIPPNTPGSYQLAFYGISGTILFDVSVNTPGSLTAYAV